ncbi:MAG: hypothetical protein O3A48_00355 [Actinomycetota bacterium]|nr:hypothetical protein [Actinomycetota bacterium]MDA3012981.1 hypothetical protein [Actinomycetota bacterium]
MKNKLNIFFFILVVLIIFFITYKSLQPTKFGEEFLNQIYIADSDENFKNLKDKEIIEIGKNICNSAEEWQNADDSLLNISKILLTFGIELESTNRIIPILRFQSIYELCPEKVSVLENLFQNE